MLASLRVLILEDRPTDAELAQFELQEAGFSFVPKVVVTEEEYIRQLTDFSPDLILSDYDLPHYNGALALAEAKRRCPDIPFILVTGAIGEDRAIEILTQGAKDYVLKNRLQQRLVPAVTRALAEAEEHRARKKAEEDLREAHRNLERQVEERTERLQKEIEQHKRAEDALRESKVRFRGLVQNIPSVSVQSYGPDGSTLYWNRASEQLYGYTAGEAVGRNLTDLIVPEELREEMKAAIRRMVETGCPIPATEMTLMRKDGSTVAVFSSHAVLQIPGRAPELFRVDIDISGRKQAERNQPISTEILGILNDSLSPADAASGILTAIQRETGVEAAGIRLRSNGDFPYFAQNGFSDDFLLKENSLAAQENGGICRDENGNVRLECTCGLVISGRTDPSNPLFTPNGSFWTNDAFALLGLSADRDPRLHPRNRCIHEGFQSVALIPVRANQEIVGLLQLNDHKKGHFTPDLIHFLEVVNASVGAALMRKQKDPADVVRAPLDTA